MTHILYSQEPDNIHPQRIPTSCPGSAVVPNDTQIPGGSGAGPWGSGEGEQGLPRALGEQ